MIFRLGIEGGSLNHTLHWNAHTTQMQMHNGELTLNVPGADVGGPERRCFFSFLISCNQSLTWCASACSELIN